MPLTRARHKLNEIDQKWGPLISLVFGIVLSGVAVTLLILALQIRETGDDTAKVADDTAALAKATRALTRDANRKASLACRRALTFGPPLARFYERQQALTAVQLAAYRATIPKKC